MVTLRNSYLSYIATYKTYKENYAKPPLEKDADNIDYIRWQKESHKYERDIYLSVSCILA